MKFKTSYLVAAVVAAIMIAFPTFLGAYPLNVARSVMTYMALAITWDMLLRSGQISFGIAGLFGLGSYASILAVLRGGMDPLLSIVFATVFSGAMAYALGFAILRLRAMYFSITTLALMEIFRIVIHNMHDFSGRSGAAYGHLWRQRLSAVLALSWRFVHYNRGILVL